MCAPKMNRGCVKSRWGRVVQLVDVLIRTSCFHWKGDRERGEGWCFVGP